MASRPAARVLRQATRQLAVPQVQKRTFVSALGAARTGIKAAPKAAVTTSFQQTRGKKTIDFAGTKEVVYGMTQAGP
jgi:ketol-acid reductoisomerase